MSLYVTPEIGWVSVLLTHAVLAGLLIFLCSTSLMQADPVHHLTLLDALDECITPPTIVILRGPEPVTLRWQQELARLNYQAQQPQHQHRYLGYSVA